MVTWIHPLDGSVDETHERLGGKAHGLVTLLRLGLPVPPGFVIDTRTCAAFLQHADFPAGLDEQLTAAVGDLETTTGRRFGGGAHPLVVSVRSGAAVSMP